MRRVRRGAGHYWFVTVLSAAALLPAALASAQQGKRQTFTDEAVRQAIEKGVEYLWSTQLGDGSWANVNASNVSVNGKPLPMEYRVGPTAICVYALLESGVNPSEPKLAKALEYLAKEESEMTYCLAFRSLAYSAALAKDPKLTKYLKLLRQDTKTLILGMRKDGGYSYYCRPENTVSAPQAKGAGAPPNLVFIDDHSNGQYGLLGVWAAALRNEEIPKQYWDITLKFWLGRQNTDGGWGYTMESRKESEIAMALAGLASIYVCIDNLYNEASLACKGNQDIPAVQKAMNYVAAHFEEIPNRSWFYYGMYGAERVAFATGYKYFGQHDWYKEGRREILARQEQDGSWTVGAGPHGGGRNTSTSYALLFLLRGSRPVVFNRLEYDGDWNNRPRGLANLMRWFSGEFENDLHWQIVSFKAKVEQWHDAPLLVITGATEPKFTDGQIEQLRTFVNQGGTIFSLAECGSVAFKKGIRGVYEKLFPGKQLQLLPSTHAIYKTQYPLFGQPQLMEISNGVRPLAIHTDIDLVRSWQAGQYRMNPTYFKAAANIVAYTNNKAALAGLLHSRGTSPWPEPPTRQPRITVQIARLKHNANCDPEPLAYERFARLIGQEQAIKVEVAGPIEISELASGKAKLAAMTGTGKLELDAAQKAALKGWLEAGGTLLVDAAGGDEEFAKSAEAALLDICGQTAMKLVASSADIYSVKGFEITQASYRHEPAGAPRLRTILIKDRMAVFFTRDDITAGLIGVMCQTIKGYSPETAQALVRNLVIMTSGQAVASQGAGAGGAAGTGAVDRANFVATACTRNDLAAKAVDGDKKTKWDTGRPMKEGDWFQVDLGELSQIGSVTLDTQESPKDFPKTFKISLSSDGTTWASANPMNGGPSMQVTFPPRLRVRFIRFEVVSVDGDQPWSIYEIEVQAPGAGAAKGAGKAKGEQ
jgi:hypothetical protein